MNLALQTRSCPHCGYRIAQQTAGPAAPSSYPPPQPTSFYGGLDPDANTAKTLTLIALIIQGIFFFVGILVAVVALAAIASGGAAALGAFGIVSLVFGFGFAISLVWIGLDYFLVYKNLATEATVPNAKTPSLVLGIIQLIFGGVIPGILLIIAHLKIGDSMTRRGVRY